MKRTLILCFIFFCLNITFSQTINYQVIDDKGKVKLLGKIDRNGLTNSPFNDWFDKNYNEYIVNKKLIKSFKDSLNQYKIKYG